MKKILFVGSEVMPFAATGGLGDVLGSLPAALKRAGKDEIDVRVVMPLYSAIADEYKSKMTLLREFSLPLAWRNLYCGVKALEKDGVIYYFIDNEYYFKRSGLYGEYDDAERYAYFCTAVMRMMPEIGYYPDILHANDWQSALSVIYLNKCYRHIYEYSNIKSVFTIHNIEYQGQYGFEILGDIFALSDFDRSLVEYNGCINLVKGAIEGADRVTTVSPTYAEEIKYPQYSHKLYHALLRNDWKLSGILNGIDYDYYNPKTDTAISQRYSATAPAKKVENKLALQKELALPERKDVPMLAIVSRLAAHKGLDLVTQAVYRLLEEDIQIVILGKGDPHFESFFCTLENQFKDKVRALMTYNRDLSKRIYAAADIFIMPSKTEPCGLSQMIASRYGAVPVTRETGGLYDSIKGYWEDEKGNINGNGFTFANYSATELAERTLAAINLYHTQDKWKKLVKKVMTTDFSWDSSAQRYIELYNGLM